MKQIEFTAVYKKFKKWYVAWVEEIPGVNTQGKTLKETKENLREAVELIITSNKTLLQNELKNKTVVREPFAVSFA